MKKLFAYVSLSLSSQKIQKFLLIKVNNGYIYIKVTNPNTKKTVDCVTAIPKALKDLMVHKDRVNAYFHLFKNKKQFIYIVLACSMGVCEGTSHKNIIVFRYDTESNDVEYAHGFHYYFDNYDLMRIYDIDNNTLIWYKDMSLLPEYKGLYIQKELQKSPLSFVELY